MAWNELATSNIRDKKHCRIPDSGTSHALKKINYISF